MSAEKLLKRFQIMIAEIPLSKPLLDRINPHWHGAFELNRDYVIEYIKAPKLLMWSRFDLAAKTLLAKSIRKGRNVEWAKAVYHEHLFCWSGGGFVESDGSGKSGFEAYYETFCEILEQMGCAGFDSEKSLIPVSSDGVIHDGAHRTAAAIELGIVVPTVATDREARVYDYRFFQRCGMRDCYLDAMALEFCERSEDSFIAFLFPVEGRDDTRAIECLKKAGSIYYDRILELTRNGVHNLVAQLYRGEPWLGTAANGFAGTDSHVKNRFIEGQGVRCIFFQTDDIEKVVRAKKEIREMYGNGNYPVHVNDTYGEALRVGRQILNANGRHFLNYGRPAQFREMHQRLEDFRYAIESNNLDPHDYIVDSSSVMALYGLRKANDLDYLHIGDALVGLSPDFQSHNDELKYYGYNLDQILTDPQHYFFYDGVKVASLALVADMKQRRCEAKDLRDIEIINRINVPDGWSRRVRTQMQYFIRTLPHRFSKIRLRFFRLIPSGIQPLAKKTYRTLFKRGE